MNQYSPTRSHGRRLFVSVIVPVYNDYRNLINCLTSLAKQTYPRNLYEVIVVDNGSTEDYGNITALFPGIVSVKEEYPTSYAARNKGVSVSRGEVIAFTDSDCVPDECWIEAGVNQLAGNPDCGLVAGKIRFSYKKPGHPNPAELFDSLNYLCQKHYVLNLRFGATANVFTRKKIFDKVGLFNSALYSGGDVEWGRLVFSSGYKLVYADDVCVTHPARHSLNQIRQRNVRVQGGVYLYQKNEGANHSLITLVKSLCGLIPPIIRIMRTIWDRRLSGLRQRMGYVCVLVYAHYAISFERIRLELGFKPRGVRPV